MTYDLTELVANPYAVTDFRFNPNQPRWPKGTPGKGGKWRGTGPGGVSNSRSAMGAKAIEDAGLNEWPKKDEHAQRVLGDAADTQSKHSVPTGDGGRAYTAERSALHDRIIDGHLAGKRPPADGNKRALFMAGGTASGKSTALKANPNVTPPEAVVVDPDEIKAQLPEYQALKAAGSRYGAMAAHEESSDIAKALTARAQERNLNLVIDGTGDSKPGKFVGKIRAAAAAGYKPDVFYVDAPTEVAIDRAISRAEKTGRFVPIPEIRNQHKYVSTNFPDVAAMPEVGSLHLYNTEGPEARLVARGAGGQLDIMEPDLYSQFTAKAGE